MTIYFAVRDFGGSYLHQDWDDDYATWRQALDAWMSERPGLASSFVLELGEVLAQNMTEAELSNFTFPVLDLNYTPTADEGGYRGWLTLMRDHAAAHLT